MGKLRNWLSGKGKRVCAAVLCCSMILCNVANGAITSARNKNDITEFRLHKASIHQELEKTINKGKTVDKELEFEGNSAGEYEELLAADGNLYELKLNSKKSDGVKLQVFARLDGEPDLEEGYLVDGSEEIIFLLTNTTNKVKNAVIRIGDQKSEPIRVIPRKAVQTSSSAMEECGEEDAEVSWTEDEEVLEGTVYEAVLMDNCGIVAFSVNAGDLGLDDPKYMDEEISPESASNSTDSNAVIAEATASNAVVVEATASNAMKVYTADIGNLVVKVTAKNGVLPEKAELKVTELKEDDTETAEQFKEAKEALDAENAEYDGMMALDISFVDEEGNEIEPDGEVQVAIEMKKEALPEDVNLESLVVQHLAETEQGIEVKNVADISEKTDGKVEVNGDTAVAEFAVDGFSTFTLTWSSWAFEFVIHFESVDENGKSIGEKTGEAELKAAEQHSVSEYAEAVSGYFFTEARLNAADAQNGKVVTDFDTSTNTSGVKGTLKFYNAGVVQSTYEANWGSGTVTVSIYLVYRQSSVQIIDTIKSDGNLNAVLDSSITEAEGTTVTYSWQKKAPGSGSWEDVTDKKVGGQYILSEDGRSVNAALDKGAQYTYKVIATVTDADGKVSTHEAEYQVPYYDSLQNGSFETPKISLNYKQMSNSAYKNSGGVWQTTGVGTGGNTGKDIEILNVNYGMSPYYYWYGNEVAADGKQFVELNAEASGSLYQDVLTVPGASLNWWLSHRARGDEMTADPEYDTMYLLIMSTEQAEEADIRDQDQVMNVINNIDSYPGAAYWEFQSDDQSWHYYSSDGTSTDENGKLLEPYEVPDNQYLTRFFFVAGETDTKSASMGNFLDQVGFGYDLPPTKEGQGNLRITKKVLGISAEDINNYSVSFDVYKIGTNGDEKLAISPLTVDSFAEKTGVNADGSEYTYYEGSVFRTVDAADKKSGTDYRVTEISTAGDSGYVLDESSSHKEDITVKVLEQGTGEAEFTNAYAESKCEVIIKKEVAGNMGEKGDTEKKYSFTYETGDGETETFELADGETTSISVTAGTSLTITETQPQGYDVSWKLNGEAVQATGASYRVENVQAGMDITCVNTKDVKTPTGIFTNNRPFILLLAVALLGLTGFMLSGRRKRRYQR